MKMLQSAAIPNKPRIRRSLAISQRQAQTLLRAAQEEKAVIEVVVGNLVYRLIPKCLVDNLPRVDGTSSSEPFASLDEYREWKERTVADQD